MFLLMLDPRKKRGPKRSLCAHIGKNWPVGCHFPGRNFYALRPTRRDCPVRDGAHQSNETPGGDNTPPSADLRPWLRASRNSSNLGHLSDVHTQVAEGALPVLISAIEQR
jgi:hypothetical protein